MVDPQLIEMLVSGLLFGEQILRAAVAERAAVGAREQHVEISRHRRMQGDRTAADDATARIVIRHRGHAGDPEPFDQCFIGTEEECAIALERAADDAAKLVSRE